MLLEVGVKALIKNNQNQYLILKRCFPYEGETEVRWDIPGGRINPGEPIYQALAREIKEETGLTMTGNPRILYAQDIMRLADKHIVRLTFEVSAEPGEIKLDLQDENGTGHCDYQWVTLTEFKNLRHDIYLSPVLEIMGA